MRKERFIEELLQDNYAGYDYEQTELIYDYLNENDIIDSYISDCEVDIIAIRCEFDIVKISDALGDDLEILASSENYHLI